MKGVAKEHICMTTDTDNGAGMARGKGEWGLAGDRRSGGMGGGGDICNNANKKKDIAFLTSTQVIQLLLYQGLHFKNHWITG